MDASLPVSTSIATLADVPDFISKLYPGLSFPIPNLPSDAMRTLSEPAVSTGNVSAAGNLIS